MDSIKFKVNGVDQCVAGEVSSDVTLLEYLRRWIELRGTKYMCLEAGCGACIVSVVKSPGAPPEGVNACMVTVTSCHGWEITTIEKIGNRSDGYHPLQRSLFENNGSQCGYCSPGWVMAMYSLLKKKKMTMLEIETSLGSNVCRCTGYRPILEAFKKFATDAPDPRILDIEDLSICKKGGERCSSDCDDYDWCIVSRDDVQSGVMHIKLSDDRDWYRVNDIKDIFNVLALHKNKSYMLVAGNTAKGVYPILEYPRVLIDVSSVAALKGKYIQQNLVIGAGNTLTELTEIFESMRKRDDFEYLKVFVDHLKLVASIPVKNIGTIAGNLMIKNKHNEFVSDLFLLLNTVGAEISIVNENGFTKKVNMETFLKEDMDRKVLLNILLPPLNEDFVKIVTFKIMPRSQNAKAIVHAGFFYKLSQYNRVLQCRIAYGGLSGVFFRARKTEKYLTGRKLFDNDTLQGAVRQLDQEMVVVENPPDMSVAYRRKLALGLFYKGLLSICPQDILDQRYKSGVVRLRESRTLSSGEQSFDTNPSIWPLNQPSPKFDGLVQCAGEAHYSEDVPSLPREVFATFVLATVGLGTIENIDASVALNEPGVIAFYSAKDIPGENTFTPAGTTFYTANEELLCEKEVKFYNQPLGIIVAQTQKIAERAATLVEVTYSKIRKPVLDIKVTKHDPKRIKLFSSSKATRTGDDVAKVIKGEMSAYTQYHFCMETLVCVSHPTEEGIKLYSATQWIDVVQRMVSRVLKIQQNKVDVFLRRLGGAYGMKISRGTQLSIACAFVTHKLNTPCRFIQSLSNNMRYVGKRFPSSITFETAVNKDGVIQSNDYELFEDNGYVVDEPLAMLASDAFNNCYDKAPWDFRLYDATTDTPSNTWCRSPGSFEAVSMSELFMERISYEMNLDPLKVRLANIDRENHSEILELINTLKEKSNYEARRLEVEKFNVDNRWKKRGLRHSLLRWTPVGSLYLPVNIAVYVDGSVVVTHGGVEMGQGLNTKAAQICAYYFGISVEKVQVKPNDTTISPNSFTSGGSLTCQFVGVGIMKGCNKFLEKLEPIKKKNPNATWEELIKAAAVAEVDLQTHSMTGMADIRNYNIYGATCAEVEVDVLTGEWNIIRVDLIEDVGRSVNPVVDVGQVEGAFIMGCGYWTSEELICDPKTGEVLTDRTWTYWVPQARDIPQDFRIYFRKKSFSTEYILGAKGTGEPATCMGVVIPITMREAIVDARKESGLASDVWFPIDGPYTVEKICLACETDVIDFKFY